MARKRGGLAGFYDRNKGIIKKVAPAALSFIPGVGMPLAIAAGAAMGADREGSGYFKGFDVGGAVKGGLEGYALGKGAQMAKGMLTGAKAAGATASPGLRQNAIGATGDFFPGAGGAATNPLGATAPSAGGGSFGQKARDLFGLAKKKAGSDFRSSEVLGGIAKGIYGERQSAREAELEREKLAEERRQFDVGAGFKEREAAIAAAQEADRKRREEELMAIRAQVRAMFGGG